MPIATVDRDRVIRLAKTDPHAALLAARLIADPFSRCQALSGGEVTLPRPFFW